VWAEAGWVLRSDWRLIDPYGSVRANMLILIKESTIDWCSLKAHTRKQLTTLGRIDVATTLAYPMELGDVARGRPMAVLTGLVYTNADFARVHQISLHDDLRSSVPELLAPAVPDLPLVTFGLSQLLPGERAFWTHLEGTPVQPLPLWATLPIRGETYDFQDFFSDGSADPTDDPRWRVAGSGVVWRQASPSGATQWRRYATPLPGLVQTITRAELLPLVLLVENVVQPLRVFIDNKSVVSEAILLISAGGRGLPWPYATRPNGGLCKRFDAALRARPGRAVVVQKAKGHVDPSEVQSSFEHPMVWGWTFSWSNVNATLPAGLTHAQLPHGRVFYDRLLKWWGTLAWPAPCNSPPDPGFGQVSCVELAVLFELETHTRLPVLVDRKWHLPDLAPSVNVAQQTLKQKSMLFQAALCILQKYAVGFLAPPRCFSTAWRMHGCTQKDTSHSLAMRPRMRCPAMVHQLEQFFRIPSVRRARSQMDQPFAAVFGGAPAVDVLDHAHAGDALSVILDLGTDPPTDAVTLARLHVESRREGAEQHSVANKARARRDGRGLVLSDAGHVSYT
ncbi:unnamed protein product, partial [Prorocentrum cordatum]